jgi:hypothetical protein
MLPDIVLWLCEMHYTGSWEDPVTFFCGGGSGGGDAVSTIKREKKASKNA